MMEPADIFAEKKRSISRLRRAIRPKLRDSGFCERSGQWHDGDKTKHIPLKLCAIPAKKDSFGGVFQPVRKIPKAIVLTEVIGFTASGPIIDGYGGGLSTLGWQSIPIEDLLRLERRLPKMLVCMK